MKLQLSEHKGVHVLTVEGSIAGRDAQVLKAGIAKLFKDGKYRLVLDVRPPPQLDDGTIRELSIMNKLAQELSGEIVLAIEDAGVRQKVEKSNVASPVKTFANKVDAVAFIQSETAKSAAGPDARDEEIKQLKEQLRAKESGGELATLRGENSRLKDELAKLEDRFEKILIQRRAPADEKAYVEKIKSLEGEVEALVAQVKKLESEKPKGR
jgi:cell division protein FtsB